MLVHYFICLENYNVANIIIIIIIIDSTFYFIFQILHSKKPHHCDPLKCVTVQILYIKLFAKSIT